MHWFPHTQQEFLQVQCIHIMIVVIGDCYARCKCPTSGAELLVQYKGLASRRHTALFD